MGTTAAVIGTTHRVDFRSHESNSREMSAALSSHLTSLHRRAYRYLGNAADAEDAVQDALLSAYKHLGKFRGQAQMSTWLTAILINSARTQLRRRPRQRHVSLDEQPRGADNYPWSDRLSDCGPSPEEAFRGSELKENLSQLAQQLPPILRRAFQLRDLDGLTIREMTDRLGATEGAVKARIFRARVKLRGLMRKKLAVQPNGAMSSESK